jgi:hypothetical protein
MPLDRMRGSREIPGPQEGDAEVAERRVAMSDALAERVVRRAVAALANSYAAAPERATAARDMLVRALQGENDDADAVDGYAAAVVLAALAHGIEAEAGQGLDWLSVAALEEWDFHHPESPI